MKTLLAVDGNSILNRAFYGIRPLTTSAGLYTHAVYGFANILARQIEEVKPDAFAVAFDVKAPTFRHKQYEGYKANRKGMPEELAVQLPYAKRCAECMGARVLTLEGWEADDILGTLAELGAADEDEWRVDILTGDRDSLQLISDSTMILLATNADTIHVDRDKFIEMYGVKPEQFVDVKALMGDASDSIPGVAGIGEKTALKLIAEFSSLDSVYANIGSPNISKGIRNRLNMGQESAYMSQKLARIDCHAPIDVTLNELISDGYKHHELLELFRELEFSGLIKRFGLDELEPVSSNSERAPRNVTSLSNIDSCLDKMSGSCALIFDGSRVQVCCDGVNIYISNADSAKFTQFAVALTEKGYKTIVYDSKKYYAECPLFDEDFIFDYDVMLAAYVVDPSEGSYLAERLKLKYLGEAGDRLDASELWRLAEATKRIIVERGQERLLEEIEQPLARVLSRVERAGFKVDLRGLSSFSEQLTQRANELRERIFFAAGMEFNINSPKQLGEVLFGRLGLPTGKRNARGYSTSADVLERLAPYAPIVSDILDYRQLTKLRTTYGEGLAKAADSTGRIHSSFNQTITATGRLSSTEPNLQNIPVRTELGREMRRFFIPDSPDRVLIDADYSQIELRILAHISGDEAMLEAFRSGIDIHSVTASQVFGVPLDAVTHEMRKRAKAVNFGIVYGISDFSLAQDIGVSKKQAGEYIDSYLAKYPKVAQYLHDIVEAAGRDGYVTTMFGRRRYIPELSSGKKMLRAFGERVAMNSPIQGSAADIIKLAMINVDRTLRASGLDAKLILQVHDELIVESSRGDAEEAMSLLVKEMESAVELLLPLTVSSSIGETWYQCKQ
ncbi:MAG: DNA polymerase I [Clostridiales bacterium]|nr:DNA polymerase I [Clostridiales bacterium]